MEAMREEIGAMVEGELRDPRIGLATVSEVAIAPGGKAARVFVAVSGDEHDAKETLAGLNAAKAFVRAQIAERLGLRHCPELIFQVDRSGQYGERIGELLGRIEKRSKRGGEQPPSKEEKR